MSHNNSCSLAICSCLNLFISLIVGIVFGILLYFSIIADILLITYISLGLGILVLIFILIGAYLSTNRNFKCLALCTRRKFPCLMIGTFGLIITTMIIITIGVEYLIPLTVFTAIGAFFFSLMLISLISLISFINCILCITSMEEV